MCEHCGKLRTWFEKIDKSEGYGCEHMGDESSDIELCGQPATVLMKERYVEDHLCEEHVALENKDLDEGLGDFMRSFGLQESCDYIPIVSEESCGYVDLQSASKGKDLMPCGKKATHAKVVIDGTTLCENHAKEMGYLS